MSLSFNKKIKILLKTQRKILMEEQMGSWYAHYEIMKMLQTPRIIKWNVTEREIK